MQIIFRIFPFSLLVLALLIATTCSLKAAETENDRRASEWTVLFDGQSLKGWTLEADINWSVQAGAITADSGPVGLLTTPLPFEDYVLELEFKAAIGSNSGIFLNSEPVVKNEATDCYEINIAPQTNEFPTGSIVKFKKVTGMGERDEWRQYQITMKGGNIRVVLDGEFICEHTFKNPRPAKLLGLQKNRGVIAFRNIRIKPAH